MPLPWRQKVYSTCRQSKWNVLGSLNFFFWTLDAQLFLIDWRREARPAAFCVRKYWSCSFLPRKRLLDRFFHPLLNLPYKMKQFWGFFLFLFFFYFLPDLFSLSRSFNFCPLWLINKCKKTNEFRANQIPAGTDPESIMFEFAVKA